MHASKSKQLSGSMSQIVHFVSTGSYLSLICCAAVVDHKINRLPNKLTIPLLLLGLVTNIDSTFVSLSDAVLGAVVGYSIIRILHSIQYSLMGCARIGLGDAKLLAGLAAWFGLYSIPLFLTGAAVITLLAYPRRQWKPFGVGLGISGMLLMIHHHYFDLPLDFL